MRFLTAGEFWVGVVVTLLVLWGYNKYRESKSSG